MGNKEYLNMMDYLIALKELLMTVEYEDSTEVFQPQSSDKWLTPLLE